MSRFRIVVGLTSALLCHFFFPTAETSSLDNDQHRSHCWSLLISLFESEIENVVFVIDWNEFILSMPIHQFLKMISHSLTNFAVNVNHVCTVVSEVKILSSFAREFCASEQSVFVVSLELPSCTIKNPFTTGSPTESSISSSIWTKIQWDCVHGSSCVQVHLHPFGPLVALTSKPPSENELAEVSDVCFQPSCHPPELHSSLHSSKLQPSFHSSPFDSEVSELVSDFEFSRPERPVFDVLPLCEPLATWFALLVLLDFPYFLDSHLCLRVRAHSWTMTRSVCRLLACAFACIAVSALKTPITRTR